MKTVFYNYSVQVFDGKNYVDWGISYNTEVEAIEKLNNYLETCKELGAYGDCGDYYIKQYKNYTSKPIKVKVVKIIQEISQTTKEKIL